MPSRLEVIQKIVAERPTDPFPRYGLAMELKNLGRLDEAHAAFDALEQAFPDYVAQYLMHANVLTQLQRPSEAKAVLQRGIPVAKRVGNGHAASEMEGALDAL